MRRFPLKKTMRRFRDDRTIGPLKNIPPTTRKLGFSLSTKENDPTKEKRGERIEENGGTRGRRLACALSIMQSTVELYSHDTCHVLFMHQIFIIYKLNLSPTLNYIEKN